MFDPKIIKPLHHTQRYGKVDAPAVSEETLEKFNDLYNRSVAGADTINTLVLGATPELRDIVLSYQHKLTTVDHDAKTLQDKSQLMHYQNHPNETTIVSDWLTMNFPENTFDVILGDGALTALNKEDQTTLLDILHRILKPTGHLLLREGAVLHRRPRYAPSLHVNQYRAGQYNLFDLFFGLRLYNDNFKSIDVETRKTYLNDFKQKIDEYYKTGVLSGQERQQLYMIALELEHTLLHKEDLEALLKKAFFPKDVIHDIGSGHLSPWYFFLNEPTVVSDRPTGVVLGCNVPVNVGAVSASA
ncbi:MAG: class I SAM-dependent methyltransferase [Patescibacteria group bacterium]|jgi:SAM-dependent methyltransferase